MENTQIKRLKDPIFLFFVACLTFLPLLGLYLIADGLIKGPNYFGVRDVTVTSVDHIDYWSDGGGARFSTRSHVKYSEIGYERINRQGHTVNNMIKVDQDDVMRPLHLVKVGSEVMMKIPLSADEGRFGLNEDVEVGLGLLIFFGGLGFPLILIILAQGDRRKVENAMNLLYMMIAGMVVYVII